MSKGDPFLNGKINAYEREREKEGEKLRSISTFFRNDDLTKNFLQFSRMRHRDRMSYTGDGGAWHPDAEQFNKTEEHEAWVLQQILRDQETMPQPPPKPMSMRRGVRETIRDILLAAKDSAGPGAVEDDGYKEIM